MKRFVVAALVIAAIAGVLWFTESHAGYISTVIRGIEDVLDLGNDAGGKDLWSLGHTSIDEGHYLYFEENDSISGVGVVRMYQNSDASTYVEVKIEGKTDTEWHTLLWEGFSWASPSNHWLALTDLRRGGKSRFIGNDPVTGNWRYDVGEAGWLHDFGSGRIAFAAGTNAAYPRAVFYPDGQLSLYDVQTNGYVYLDTDGGADNSILRLRSEGDRVEVWDSFWVTNGGKLMVGPTNVVDEIASLITGSGFATTQELLAVSGRVDTIEGNTSNWNTAYSWGDHAVAGYASTSEVVAVSGRVDAVEANTSNWNTAYSWGDHGTNGYAKTSVVNTQVWSESQYPSAALSSVVATQVWGDAQYPNAVLLDGSRAWIGYQNAGGYGVTNIGTNTLSFEDGTEVYPTLQGKADILTSNATYSLDNSMSASDIQAIIDAAPKVANGNYSATFQFANGTYNLSSDLNFSGFAYEIRVYGNTAKTGRRTDQDVHLNFTGGTYHLAFWKCFFFDVRSLKITGSNWNVFASNCGSATLYYNYLINTGSGGANVYNNQGFMYVRDTYVSATAGGDHGINTTRAGALYSHNNADTGGQPEYGLTVSGAITFKESTQPTGSVANEKEDFGGQIWP